MIANMAATNTNFYSPNPAINPTAPSTFISNFNGILKAFLPGSSASKNLNPNSNTSYAKYSKSGC